jgi:glutaredoxin-related protein
MTNLFFGCGFSLNVAEMLKIGYGNNFVSVHILTNSCL